MSFSYSGFADEASPGIDGQIAATRALGWSRIEARNIDGVNLTDISEADFERVCAALQESGVAVDCFGSAVANWSCDPFCDEDFERSKAALRRALARMEVLGCGAIRGMSFAMQKARDPFDPEVEARVFPRVRELAQMCGEAGKLYLHENCMNYGGQSYRHTLKLLEAVDCDAFRLVFDTGNPVMTDLRLGEKPYRLQSTLEFYTQVREFIARVHIKDCRFVAPASTGLFPQADYCYPGAGDGEVDKIITDLKRRYPDMTLSIEPHMATVFHEQGERDGELSYRVYVEYGRKLMELVDRC